MKKQSIYTSDSLIKAAILFCEQHVRPFQSEYFRMLKRYGISFCRSRNQNMQLMWAHAQSKQDNLPITHPRRIRMMLDGSWKSRNQSVSCIFEFMESAGMLTDYNYLCAQKTTELEVFLSTTLALDMNIRDISSRDLYECQDFGKLFSAYAKKNADPATIAHTEKTKSLFDAILRGADQMTEKQALINLFSAYAMAETMNVDLLHTMIHSAR